MTIGTSIALRPTVASWEGKLRVAAAVAQSALYSFIEYHYLRCQRLFIDLNELIGVSRLLGMGRLSIGNLKSAYTVRLWRNIISNNPYVAIVQITGGKSWGRANMRSRVLGDLFKSGKVDARYAVPWAAREGAAQANFVGLSQLFRSSPSAVIFGSDLNAVLEVLERATNMLEGGVLVGGRFESEIITAQSWIEVRELGGQEAVRKGLIRALQTTPGFIRALDDSAKQLVRVGISAGGAQSLARVLDVRVHDLAENESKPEGPPTS